LVYDLPLSKYGGANYHIRDLKRSIELIELESEQRREYGERTKTTRCSIRVVKS